MTPKELRKLAAEHDARDTANGLEPDVLARKTAAALRAYADSLERAEWNTRAAAAPSATPKDPK